MTVLVNADELSTDLTGFSLIDSDDFRQRREEVLRAAGQALRGLGVGESLFADDHDNFSHLDPPAQDVESTSDNPKDLKTSSLVLAALSQLTNAPAIVTRLISGQDWRDRRATERLLSSQDEVLDAIDRDIRHVVEQLTGDKPPPPPQRRVEFVFKNQNP